MNQQTNCLMNDTKAEKVLKVLRIDSLNDSDLNWTTRFVVLEVEPKYKLTFDYKPILDIVTTPTRNNSNSIADFCLGVSYSNAIAIVEAEYFLQLKHRKIKSGRKHKREYWLMSHDPENESTFIKTMDFDFRSYKAALHYLREKGHGKGFTPDFKPWYLNEDKCLIANKFPLPGVFYAGEDSNSR